MKPSTKDLSANLLLTLCEAASKISKGSPLVVTAKNKRAVEALERRGLMLVREEGAVPSMDGFRKVKGLAPVPVMIIREDNAREVAPKAKAAFLAAVGATKAYLFADETGLVYGAGSEARGCIRTLNDLRQEMTRMCPSTLSVFDNNDISFDTPVFVR